MIDNMGTKWYTNDAQLLREDLFMKFLSIRELRSSTARIRDMLSDDGKIVLTTNGKPAAIMIEVDEDSFEDVLDDLRASRSRRAIRLLQEQAVKQGLNTMTLDEINVEISAARSEGA